jgi:hypothetical protein
MREPAPRVPEWVIFAAIVMASVLAFAFLPDARESSHRAPLPSPSGSPS